ncbi:uncharacterized protein LOC141643389 isoform X3 [Silene latifolia]|uniref:uncharacterized protein LOC141643389 isoform X3 n=1 Tax=Silene latifolia TaxID=37657 RepID=UPI003D7878F5
MSHHTPIELLSDDDDDDINNKSYKTPISNKRRRSNFQLPLNPNDFFIIPLDDDPTPPTLRNSQTPLVIPETPFSELPPKQRPLPSSSSPPSLPGDLELINVESQDKDEKDPMKGVCANNLGSRSVFDEGKNLESVFSVEEKDDGALQQWLDIDSMCYLHTTVPSNVHNKNGDIGKIISLDDGGSFPDSCSELYSENSCVFGVKNCQEKKGVSADIHVECLEESPIIVQSTSESGSFQSTKTHHSSYFQDSTSQYFHTENNGARSGSKAIYKEQSREQGPNKNKAEEKLRQMEEKKLRKEQEKLQKAALKAEAAKLKELEKEKKKLEKFKFSEKNIVAKIDAKVIQLGKIGGHLVTMFGDKGLKFELTSNLVEKSIIWSMSVPEGTSQLSLPTSEIPYILLVYEAEEFCKIVNDGSFFNHISSVQTRYPDYKICCLTNRLMSYINKRENDKYKNRNDSSCWKRPPVEEVFAKLTTQFANVHSRKCADEAELAEHVVGLTLNLAKCHSRKKLTHLTVNANGSNVPKDCVDRRLIMKHPWLKALVSIPKVQPRFAIAIWKKYPNMKSLLSAYLDPTKSVSIWSMVHCFSFSAKGLYTLMKVHEKEFLLKDLQVECLLGNEDRRLGELCSKRVYRILMAQNGSINTDDVENGADFFMQQT